MSKIGKGTAFNLTEKRLRESLTMLNQQHTTTSIALHFGIDRNTLHDKFKEAGLDVHAIRNKGRLSMKAMLYGTVMAIPDEHKRADAALKFLSQYPADEDDVDLVDDESSGSKLEKAIAKVSEMMSSKAITKSD